MTLEKDCKVEYKGLTSLGKAIIVINHKTYTLEKGDEVTLR